jgi:hypothetical protein
MERGIHMSKLTRMLSFTIVFSIMLSSLAFANANPCGMDCMAAQLVVPGETTCYCVFCGMCGASDPYNPDLEIYYINQVEISRRCAYYPVPCGYLKALPLVVTK